MKKIILFLIILSSLLFAQGEKKNLGGFSFTMVEDGTGLGGFIGREINDYYLGTNLDFFILRGTKEFTYYNYYGFLRTINKKNSTYLFNLYITGKKRFFKDSVSDDFRPYLFMATGIVFGMNFPRIEYNIYNIPMRNKYLWTWGGSLGAGVDMLFEEIRFAAIRIEYNIMPFKEKLGEKSNRSMFCIRFEIGQKF